MCNTRPVKPSVDGQNANILRSATDTLVGDSNRLENLKILQTYNKQGLKLLLRKRRPKMSGTR